MNIQTVQPTQCHLWTKKLLSQSDLDFDYIEDWSSDEMADLQHCWNYLVKCNSCGQIYFYQMREEGREFGDEQMYHTFIPIENDQTVIDQLKQIGPYKIMAVAPQLGCDSDYKNFNWIK